MESQQEQCVFNYDEGSGGGKRNQGCRRADEGVTKSGFSLRQKAGKRESKEVTFKERIEMVQEVQRKSSSPDRAANRKTRTCG